MRGRQNKARVVASSSAPQPTSNAPVTFVNGLSSARLDLAAPSAILPVPPPSQTSSSQRVAKAVLRSQNRTQKFRKKKTKSTYKPYQSHFILFARENELKPEPFEGVYPSKVIYWLEERYVKSEERRFLTQADKLMAVAALVDLQVRQKEIDFIPEHVSHLRAGGCSDWLRTQAKVSNQRNRNKGTKRCKLI